jgi:hypothetical protein
VAGNNGSGFLMSSLRPEGLARRNAMAKRDPGESRCL